ncbi:MAG: response regulator [Marinicella sp.]
MDKHHILVVDDNHINRLFFESSLKKLNVSVKSAESGYQAIELCQLNTFDLILMDIRMNGMDGIETAAQIKTINTYSNTPILAVSAEHFNCRNHLDFVASILKPVSQEQLKHVIEMHLSKGQLDVTPEFDHELALQISHDDNQIVQKLRTMYISQLPKDWQQIEKLHQSADRSGLDAYLHKMLGSAKVCAAALLIKRIEEIKTKLSTQADYSDEYLQLKIAVEKTLNK